MLKALAQEPLLAEQKVRSSTISGTVTLTGTVADAAHRDVVEQIVARTAGVTKVIDQLAVGRVEVAEKTSQDSPIGGQQSAQKRHCKQAGTEDMARTLDQQTLEIDVAVFCRAPWMLYEGRLRTDPRGTRCFVEKRRDVTLRATGLRLLGHEWLSNLEHSRSMGGLCSPPCP